MIMVKVAGLLLKERRGFRRKVSTDYAFDTYHAFRKMVISIGVWNKTPWCFFCLEPGNVPVSILET